MSGVGADGGVLAGRAICLLSPMHPSANPRLVKSADALAGAGARVRVVTLARDPAHLGRDGAVVGPAPWRHEAIDVRRRIGTPGIRWGLARLRAASAGGRAEPVVAPFTRVLVARALRERADLYIAHTLGALPAARIAAGRQAALLGYDAEDLESGIGTAGSSAAARLRAIESRHLPACDQITAASEGIAAAYARRLSIPEPVTIHNVFPWAERDRVGDAAFAGEREHCALSLYWYSQTIGPDRGLGDALEALRLLPAGVHLHLRGRWAAGYESTFRALAGRLGVARRVHLREVAPPGELVARAAEHDVGLALESPETENRRVCQTNKLFVYPLAGLAVAASDTEGQRLVHAAMPGAGLLYPPGDAPALARGIRAWSDDPQRLARAREEALRAARERWCWEREAPRLVELVRRTLDR